MNSSNIIPVIALGAILCSCAGKSGEQAAAGIPAAETVQSVSVTVAQKQDVPQVGTYSTTVQANVVNNIASQSAGRIQKLNVEVGDFVSAGQILAEMDRVQLNQAELNLKNSELELGRVKGLLAEGGISQSDFDALELNYNVTKANYENLLENTVLRAPVSGVISARNYDRGDMYAMSSPIYTLQQITPVKLLVPVSETDYTKVKKGDSVTIETDAFPGKTFKGTIIRLYPVIDSGSHTFNVEVRVANDSRELRPGMYARATINFGSNNSIVIPDSAVMKQQGSGVKTVFVLNDDSTVSSKVVTLGRHFGQEYEILSGLDEGDKVVYQGNSTLKSGEKVEVAQ